MKRQTPVLLLSLLLALPLPALAQDSSLFSNKDRTLAELSKATALTLTEDGVTITAPGTYVLSGAVSNGSITVTPNTEGDVYLLLNGVSIHNDNGAALVSNGCKKLILTLAEGSVNTFSQGSGTPSDEDQDAAIYSRDDLTINGSGTLVIHGGYADGINCRDSLRIVDGDITVTAVDDGIVGKDEVSIGGGRITVTATEGDGIKSTNEEDSSRGFVAIAGGEITVITGSGHGAATRATSGYGRNMPSTQQTNASSQKGIKAITSVSVSGGSVTVDTVDDALHANGDIRISGGTLSLASGDDGIHADAQLAISGGTVDVVSSYEGLEASDIVISGGEISAVSTDDGINGAGGNDEQTDSTGMGRFGRDMFSSSSGTMTVSGGHITVVADGDGVDVNGSITMTGGTLLVRGSQNSGNGALDYDSSFTMTGGTLIAAGMSGMAQGVTSTTVPGAVFTPQASGTIVCLSADAQEIVSFDVPGSYSHVVLFSDALLQGESFTVRTGSTQQTLVASLDTQTGTGGMGGGRRRGF